ncbi:DUF2911 domain-containing protein [Algoriphagus jejuensis]|uniref:DUF2911 domain-containing protein n=1 Tax=Algoriphagus jejuensis TaxID=419934 RepID=A0ABN1MUU0_9BACT
MTRKFYFSLMTMLLASFVSFSQQLQMPQASPSSKISQQFGLSVVTVDYSRPSTKGRKIFGELVPYGQIWRTGANSATQINFSTEVSISGQTVPAGNYALYAIPEKSHWTLILSKNTKLWGAIGYDQSEDQLRFQVPVTKTKNKSESFEIGFNNITDNSAVASVAWENSQVEFKIETKVDPIVMAEIQKLVIDAKSTDPTLLFQAANYYFTTSKDLNQAYAWVKESTDKDPKYWTMYLRAKIEMALGMKTEAHDSATKSKSMAAAEENPDYVSLNERLINSIK